MASRRDEESPRGAGEKQQSLEDSFFSRARPELRARLREAERERTRQMEMLAEISGIADVAVLEKLVVLGIRNETLSALTLYPLVAVAWADGTVDAHERDAVLKGAEACGIDRDAVSYQLLADWLEYPPDGLLLAAWKGFVADLSHQLEEDWRQRFEREILSRARAVANASGGFLALDKTSGSEQTVLDELKAAFRPDAD